jgi:osmotically-inducible protein OsmY
MHTRLIQLQGEAMKHIQKSLVATAAVAALLALGACGQKQDDTTMGQKMDTAATKTEQVASEVKTDVTNAAQDAKVAITNAGEKMAEKLDDATITAEVNAGLAKDATLSALKINVDTRDGRVTLKGPAPSADARARATEIAKSVKGVSAVDNQLTVNAG